MSQNARLPDFLIIGAPKSATTWLARNLEAHPQIAVHPEEIHYFSRFHDKWSLAQYAAKLSGLAGDLIGEKSNSYLTDSHSAARIRAAIPQVKLIAMLRDPVERAYSSYCMQVDRGRADGDVARFLNPERTPLPHIINNSHYYSLLKVYYDTFPREQLHICLFEDMRHSAASMYRDVTRFLGVPDFESDRLHVRFNEKGGDGPGGALARLRWLFHHSPLAGTRLYDTIRNAVPVERLFRRKAQPIAYPAMTEEIRNRLRDYYRPEIELLERLTAIPLRTRWQ